MNRRHFLKACASSLVAIGCSQAWPMTTGGEAAGKGVPVILYHRIGYTSGQLTVTPERFAEDLNLLSGYGYETITLQQFQNYIFGHVTNLPDNPVLITFDDGYLDNYENAFPILQKYGMSATFFVITGLLWNADRLQPAHIQEMDRAGMSFGSHTVSHRSLGKLSPEDAAEELNSSRSTMESILGKTVQTIAYPQGSYNAYTLQSANDTGYLNAFTTVSGNCSWGSGALELPRIPIFSYDRNVIAVMQRNGVYV